MFIFALAGGPCPRAEDFGQNPWVDHLCLKPMRPNVRLDSQLMSTQDVHAFLQPCCTVLPDTPMGIQWGMLPSCQRPLPHRFQGWQGWCTCYAMLGIWEDNATAEPHSVVYVVLVWSLIDSKCLYLQCSFSSFKSLACLKLDTGWYWKNTGRSESGCLGRCDTASWYSRYIMAHLHIVKIHSKNQRNLYRHINVNLSHQQICMV